jgi:hypothetical protein
MMNSWRMMRIDRSLLHLGIRKVSGYLGSWAFVALVYWSIGADNPAVDKIMTQTMDTATTAL